MNKYKHSIGILKNAIQTYGADYDKLHGILEMCSGLLKENPEEKEYCFKWTNYVKEAAQALHIQTTDEIYGNLYWETVRFETPYSFESFIYYMEKNRQPEKKFYKPRKETLHVVVEDLQRLEDKSDNSVFYGLSMPSRVGKELADDTPILTRNGWKNHGDLVVGDEVLNSKGEFVKVYHVFPKCNSTHIVRFSDGEEIECHENHEWIVYDRSRQKTRVIETKELIGKCLYNYTVNGKNYKRCRFQINHKDAVIGETKKLPVDPYTLGAWLGDGTNKVPCITSDKEDLEISKKIEKNGYPIRNTYIHRDYGTYRLTFDGLREQLQKIGMCHSRKTTTKHIPDIYFTASIKQRLELLAGLIDTDGMLKSKERRYSFSTTEPRLKDDFVTLVSTFGWRTSVVTYPAKTSSSGVVGRKDVYRVDFNPTIEIPCVLERKQLKEFSKQRKIGIVDVFESEKKTQGNCISVVGGEYLAGRTLKPTHNSTVCIFFLAWIAYKRPNSHSAMGGHSGILAKGFYKELLNLITTPEYTFKELFDYLHPEYANKPFPTDKSADEFTITLGDPDRFATITCRGIDGTWTGAIDVSEDGYLYVDDLVRDREHSLSPQRMNNTFQEYLNKMVDRKNDGARELMVGTLWNVLDPLEQIRNKEKDNPYYVFRKIPALNENGESNFAYKIHGFSTKYYLDMKARLDPAEWAAKFMQEPYVREGILFKPGELRYFNGILPEGDHRIIAVVDVALGGGDYLSMPVGAEYGNGDVYIFDWVYNKGVKEVTAPLVAGRIMGNGIRQTRFEANQGGDLYCDFIDELLRKQNYKCSCTHKRASNKMEKEQKIIAYSGDIKRNYVFLKKRKPTQEEMDSDASLGIKRYYRSDEYEEAMDWLTHYVTIGKNEHDDAPDSLTQLEIFREGNGIATAEATTNPFRSIYGGY